MLLYYEGQGLQLENSNVKFVYDNYYDVPNTLYDSLKATYMAFKSVGLKSVPADKKIIEVKKFQDKAGYTMDSAEVDSTKNENKGQQPNKGGDEEKDGAVESL